MRIKWSVTALQNELQTANNEQEQIEILRKYYIWARRALRRYKSRPGKSINHRAMKIKIFIEQHKLSGELREEFDHNY